MPGLPEAIAPSTAAWNFSAASCQSAPLRARRGLGGVQRSGAHGLLKKEQNDLDRRSSRRGSIMPDAILRTFYWEEDEATE